MSAENFRILTLLAVFAACLWLPGALLWRVPGNRTWLIVLTLELQFVGAAAAIADSWHRPIALYRSPRILLSALIALTYCWLSRRDRRRGRRR